MTQWVTYLTVRGQAGNGFNVVELVTAGLFLSALLASLIMAWTIGAGSAGSTPFAPAVGANAIPVMQAAFVVGLCILLGAIVQGANVSEAVGRELIVGVELTVIGATVALVIAASLVVVGVFTGYPIATAFTVTGAVIGVGLGLGGAPAWEKYAEIATLWTLTPIVGAGAAYGIAIRLLTPTSQEERIVPFLGGIVGLVLGHIELAFLGSADAAESVVSAIALSTPGPALATYGVLSAGLFFLGWWSIRRWIQQDVVRAERRFALVLGAIVAFSAGGSQVGLAVGPLLPILDGVVPLLVILLGGGIGLLIGAWTGAPRLIKAVAQDYSSLGPRRSIAALIPSFVIAQIAILFGIPVSFNQIIVSAIIGSGAAAQSGPGVSRRKVVLTFAAWIGSFILALGIGYALMKLVILIT